MRNFVASFAALTEASEIFILDGTDKNRDILCDLALDEPTTNESPMLAARQTLQYVLKTRNLDENDWNMVPIFE